DGVRPSPVPPAAAHRPWAATARASAQSIVAFGGNGTLSCMARSGRDCAPATALSARSLTSHQARPTTPTAGSPPASGANVDRGALWPGYRRPTFLPGNLHRYVPPPRPRHRQGG